MVSFSLCWRSLFATIIGSVCPLCHERVTAEGICAACMGEFFHETNVCPMCANYTPHGALCGRCQQKQPFYDALFVSYELNEVLLNLIHAYKYQRQLQLSGALEDLLISQVPEFDMNQIDYIVSVPISKQHLWQRGFNQSHLLAKKVSRCYQKMLLPEKVFTRQSKPSQATLRYKERQQNVKNVFTWQGEQSLKDKTVLVIDDIATTGATLNELARCLKKQGAKYVYSWALAKRSRLDDF